MTFGVMWGYPFLTVGQGLSPGLAGALMLVLALAGLVYGVTLGTFMARHPYYRSLIAIGGGGGGGGDLGGRAAVAGPARRSGCSSCWCWPCRLPPSAR